MSEPQKPKADPAVPPAAKPKADAPPAKPPSFDERSLKLAELLPHGKGFDAGELVAMLRDGRAIVRGNAALGLAAAGQPAPELVPLLRDSEVKVATQVAEALAHLGGAARPLIPQIVASLDGAKPEVMEIAVAALAQWVGAADDELILALDVPLPLANATVIEASGQLGAKGIAFLIRATGHERSRIRINAIAGLGRLGKTDPEPALACLAVIEQTDPVPDTRTAAKQAMLAIVAREKVAAVDALPKNIPDFEERKLSASELREYADVIDIDQMMFALQDGRDHVKINAARALSTKGAKAGRAAKAMGLLLRDSSAAVRRDVAKALGKLGDAAVGAAPDLVGALGDKEDDVAEAAAESLEELGDRARDALIAGLDTGNEAGGRRVGELIGKLPGAADLLTEAFASPAVNTQVNAALGLGMLGADKVGRGMAALLGARTGGDARTRDAVRRALDMLGPKGPTGPKAVAIDGFEDRPLAAADLEKSKPELEKVGVADLVEYLRDGRDTVRANAATALGVLGAAAAGAARSLGVLCRDDAPRVRLCAVQAIDKLGDAAVVEVADDLVRTLGDPEAKVADTAAQVIRARKGKMIGALVRGLETDKPEAGRRAGELLGVFEDAVELLVEAFGSPAVNTQVNAALALGMLGKKVGKGRKALEGARTGGDARTREAVFRALEMLDGPKASGPQVPAVDGFEARVLEPAAFTDPAKLDLGSLIAFLTDGRATVRANSATAVGVLGPAAAGAALAVGVLLRDDDPKVRIQAAWAIDKMGDDAVKQVVDYLVGALRGDADVAKAVAAVLAPRKTRVLTGLLKGLETDDETHAKRILELIGALPDACEILCDAFASPAENVQVNSAIGIGMLGAKKAGSQGRKTLEGARTGGFARTREAVFKGLAMLRDNP
jgi:HEAT repeat protein